MKKLNLLALLLIVYMCQSACNPDFLDIKRDKSQTVPASLSDFRAMMDNFTDMNANAGHSLSITASDEYYLLDNVWELLSSAEQRNAYHWAVDVFESEDSRDWNNQYRRVLYANLILEGLEGLEPTGEDISEYEQVKGMALFIRAMSFYTLSQTFSPILSAKELNQYGLPLRLESDPTLVSKRSTVEETYEQIIQDASQAVELMSASESGNTRPSKRAAYSLLSRVYLQIKNYEKSLRFADLALSLNDVLLDYNDIDAATRYPFPVHGVGNGEMIFYEISNASTIFTVSRSRIDTTLFELYDEDDLRKSLYFFENPDRSHSFRGSYCGMSLYFTGLANDENVLNKAEALVRLGKVSEGLDALNLLLVKRYRNNSFVPYADLDQSDALEVVLEERRKELLFRGIRWSDLRRLNTDKESETVLMRELKGKVYELLPNDPRYIFPIPESVLLNSDVKQFPRVE